jgi:cell volume regulation protein A
VSVLERDGEALLPRGSSEVEAGDRLHILVRATVRDSMESLFARWRSGPIGVREAQPFAPPPSGRSPIFVVKPWREEMGDVAHPEAVEGIEVLRQMRTRREEPGALVLLADGRFAVTGEGIVATGGGRQLFRYCRERIHRAESGPARAWWQEVAGAVSQTTAR